MCLWLYTIQHGTVLIISRLGRYGSFHYRMNAGCAGKTVRSLKEKCHTWAIQVYSQQSAIQIHICLYITFPLPLILQTVITAQMLSIRGDVVSYGRCKMSFVQDQPFLWPYTSTVTVPLLHCCCRCHMHLGAIAGQPGNGIIVCRV